MTDLKPIAALFLLAATPLAAQDVATGAALYQTHCAVCHGVDAEGAGPLSGALVVQPPDLTALQSGNENVFPMVRVVMRIDGRDPLVSHGSPMPVFGPFFDGPDTPLQAETGQPIFTTREVADLVAYLQALQD